MSKIDWKIINKSLKNKLSIEEEDILNDWLNASYLNRSYYNKVIGFEKSSIKPEDIEQEFESFKQRVEKRNVKTLNTVLKYAASIAALFVVAFIIKYSVDSSKKQTNYFVGNQIIEPGKGVAILYTSDGGFFELRGTEQKDLKVEDDIVLKQEDNTINYNTNSQTVKPVLHRIQVPRGGEFSLTLCDGTMIYLNSESVLSYQVPFSDTLRQVEIYGEAYFNVAKDEMRPFVVDCQNNISVEVLGTQFNISNYNGDNSLSTTLVEGHVKMSSSGNSYVLNPGEQAVVNAGILQEKKRVNVEAYVAWTQGRFYFEDETLESIMLRLERWYDVDVSFDNEALKYIRFTGNISRYKNFNDILDKIYKLNEVYFVVNKDKVNVKKITRKRG